MEIHNIETCLFSGDEESSSEDLSYTQRIEGKPSWLLKKPAAETLNLAENGRVEENLSLGELVQKLGDNGLTSYLSSSSSDEGKENQEECESLVVEEEIPLIPINGTIKSISILGPGAIVYPEKKEIKRRVDEIMMLRKSVFDNIIAVITKIDSQVLTEQGSYFISTAPVQDPGQRETIKTALISLTLCPITWISDRELEVVVDPFRRLKKGA